MALPEGYSARPATLDDAAGVAALIASHQLADFGSVQVSEEEVRADWAGSDLAADTIVVQRAGVIRAAADLIDRPGLVSVYGYVHPDHTGRGLGSFLAEWGEQRAALQAGPTVVRHHVTSTNLAAVTLFEERGYETHRAVLWMERELDSGVVGKTTGSNGTVLGHGPGAGPRGLPSGLTLRTYRGEADEPAVHHAFEAASRDMNGRAPNTLEQWLATVRTKDNDLFFVVEDGVEPAAGNAIVGILIASLQEALTTLPTGAAAGDATVPAAPTMGHVDSLRVAKQWRRRGIGAALLATAFEALRERGAGRVGLSVDAASPTGAPNLYLAAGMRVTRRYLVMELTVAGR